MKRISVRPGWPGAAAYVEQVKGDVDTEKVGHALLPRHFELSVGETDAQGEVLWAINLLFDIEDAVVQLRAVLCFPMEVPEALAMLRRERSIDAWKRIALASLLADDVEEGLRIADQADGATGSAEDERSNAVGDAIRYAFHVPIARRRNRITPELLREVADVYRTAWSDGQAPTAAVAEHFQVSHSTAARWVGKAREAGALGAADGTRGGERPVKEED